MEKVDVPDWDVVQLDPETAAVWLEPAVDNTQSNSALEVYFQLPGRDSWAWNKDMARRRVLLCLLEDMMYEPIYDELRTKQQLGYSVGCCFREAWTTYDNFTFLACLLPNLPN